MAARKILLMLSALALLSACGADLPGARDRATPAEPVTYEGIRFETSAGSFTAILYPEAAPETVARYLEYVDSGFHVGRSFDRVIPGFMIQATDCAISAATRDSRTLPLEVTEEHFFSAGALGIARAADPNSGGSEFFVMDFAAGHLAGDYTVWGQVVEGLEVIRSAARVQTIDLTAGGQVPGVVGDRCAVQPVEITATSRVNVTLEAEQAAALPMKTAERVRTETAAYNLEWPATLAAGRDSALTAYITHYDGTAPPAAGALSIAIDGAEPVALEGDAAIAGIYRFHWTPPAAGEYEVVFSSGGTELAILYIQVP